MFLTVLLNVHTAKTNSVNIAPGIHLFKIQRQIPRMNVTPETQLFEFKFVFCHL